MPRFDVTEPSDNVSQVVEYASIQGQGVRRPCFPQNRLDMTGNVQSRISDPIDKVR